MTEAVALGPPDQAAILEQLVVVTKIDPVIRNRGLFGEDRRQRARLRIDPEHVEHGLLAVLALDVERAAIGRPVHAGEVEIGRIAFGIDSRLLMRGEIDLHPVLTVGIHHIEFDIGVFAARDRIALVEHPGARRADRRPRHDADHALVEALDRDAPVVGAPPIAGHPAHFLLRDELGLAPAYRLALARRDRCGLAPRLADPQLAIADEGNVAARIAERGIEFAFLGIGQPYHFPAHSREVEIAIERDQHAGAILGPLIVDDALQAADPRALALHLLLLGQFAARTQHLAVDQHRPFARIAVIGPQIVAFAVVGAIAQHGKITPVG